MTFAAEQLEATRREHNRTLIAEFGGNSAPARSLLDRLSKVWCSRGKLNLLELQNNFILCSLTDEQDMVRVRLG